MRQHLQRLREHLEPIGIAPAEALALLILLAAAATLTGVVWWTNQPAVSEAATAVSEAATALAGSTPPSPAPPTPTAGLGAAVGGGSLGAEGDGVVVVHVAGQVVRPGVVTLPVGSRVGEAIQAAGGPTGQAQLDDLNLARALSDGEQVRVPGPGEDLPAVDATVQGSTDDPVPVDLNAATVEQLQSLPGIGPVMAQRIVEHRQTIGGFAAVTQLLEVPGIGPARFADLEDRVTV